MFGIGGSELIIIAFVVLLLFGPDKLPEMARTIGRFMREFKRYQAMMESTFKAEMYLAEQNAQAEKAMKGSAAAKAVDKDVEEAPASDPYQKAREYRQQAGVVAPGETLPGGLPEVVPPATEDVDDDDAPIAPEDAGWTPGAPDAPGMTADADDDGEEAGEQQ
ncbi:MAG: twin-arginine translocase TatA/TatE family subunit [Actinobacteria bacterium]|nr:MAG: twin-arginine translocase TatA/TatE family subunit [Actinomycetota bacterium]